MCLWRVAFDAYELFRIGNGDEGLELWRRGRDSITAILLSRCNPYTSAIILCV